MTNWIDPLTFVAKIAKIEDEFVFLYSGQKIGEYGRYSYLAYSPKKIVSGNDFRKLKNVLSRDKAKIANAWFGYIGYEMLHQIEQVPHTTKQYISLPNVWFANFETIIVFDHLKKEVNFYGDSYSIPAIIVPREYEDSPKISRLTSNMTREEYFNIIKETREAILRGDLYQANITRKFLGRFSKLANPFDIFTKLTQASPAIYSAFIAINGSYIISSSPECFLNIDKNGRMESRPIKGTAPRFADAKQDEESKRQLEKSEKERAENLMIVDLMRNDLARSSEAGSVKVEKLFEVSSYKTLHHLASTITSQKRNNISTLDAVINSFPAGSMTGAPKVSAMKFCNRQEKIKRGVYSGALGWFGGDGSCDLSVVIRTLIIHGNKFEFQVGGGITSDSDPEKEWQETIIKARGIMTALGADIRVLEEL